MNDWYFVEQQSVYRQQALLCEAEQRSIFAQVPQASIRAQVAGALIAVAMRLAPATATGQLNRKRTLTGIAGS